MWGEGNFSFNTRKTENFHCDTEKFCVALNMQGDFPVRRREIFFLFKICRKFSLWPRKIYYFTKMFFLLPKNWIEILTDQGREKIPFICCCGPASQRLTKGKSIVFFRRVVIDVLEDLLPLQSATYVTRTEYKHLFVNQ